MDRLKAWLYSRFLASKKYKTGYRHGYNDGYQEGFFHAQRQQWTIDNETGEEVLIEDGKITARRSRSYGSWVKYYSH